MRNIYTNPMPRRVNKPSIVPTCLGILVGFVLIVALNAWWAMLLLGALGHIFEVSKLFVSFGEAAVVSLALSFVASMLRGVVNVSK